MSLVRCGKALALSGLFLAGLMSAWESNADPAVSSGSGALALQQLVSAAKKEGRVTLYDAVPNTSNKVAEAFQKIYGIPVDVLELPSGSLLQRFSSESQANAKSADVLIAASLERSAPDMVARGWIEPIRSSSIPTISGGVFPASYVNADTATLGFMPFIIAYNSDKIHKDQAPKEFVDLGASRYKNQLLLVDPETSETHIQMWDKVLRAKGDKAVQAIGANKPRLYDSASAVAEALAAGEGLVGVTTMPGLINVLAVGAPVGYTMPKSTTGAEMQIALIPGTKRPHPAAGRLLANFLLTPEGNKILCEGMVGVLDNSLPAAQIVSLKPDATAIKRKGVILGLLGLKK